MTLGDIIRSFRLENDISQDEFARRTSLSKAYISILERNYNPSSGRPPIPSLETIKAVATATNRRLDDVLQMLDSDQLVSLAPNIKPLPRFVKKPRLGAIACGEPILAMEEADEFDDVPEEIDCDFTLLCKGDSMINARIFDGDIVYIRSQSAVDDGEIAAVLIDDEATLKRVRLFSDHISLEPANPMYSPLVFWGEEMNCVRIIGKAVAFTSKIR